MMIIKSLGVWESPFFGHYYCEMTVCTFDQAQWSIVGARDLMRIDSKPTTEKWQVERGGRGISCMEEERTVGRKNGRKKLDTSAVL